MRNFVHVLTVLCGIAGVTGSSFAQDSATAYLKDKMPERWGYSPAISAGVADKDEENDWWRNFEDPLLDSLVIEGFQNNFSVQIAVRRINIAANQVRQAMSGYYPSVNLNGGYTYGRNAGAISGSHIKSSTSSYFSLGADMSWEIDLFGRITSQVKGKKANLNVSKADYEGTMLSIAANISTYYVNLRTFQENLFVTKEHLASQSKVVEIAKARFEAGLVSKLDVTQAETVYYSTEAKIPQLETSINESINALAVLLGVYPETIRPRLVYKGSHPRLQHLVSTGFPADLLRRRPDIIEAEAQLAVYAAQIGIAKKDFLPSLSLNGSIGVAAHKPKDLFGKNSLEYSIAPTLSWNLFDGFSRKYALQEAREQMEKGIDNYNLIVLTAVNEVDNAMSSYLASLQIIDSNSNGLKQSSESFDLSVNLYKQGLTPFSNVVDAQINTLSYANSLISARGEALVSLVNLYKALGGSISVK